MAQRLRPPLPSSKYTSYHSFCLERQKLIHYVTSHLPKKSYDFSGALLGSGFSVAGLAERHEVIFSMGAAAINGQDMMNLIGGDEAA